jgi:hypothetical protein
MRREHFAQPLPGLERVCVYWFRWFAPPANFHQPSGLHESADLLDRNDSTIDLLGFLKALTSLIKRMRHYPTALFLSNGYHERALDHP